MLPLDSVQDYPGAPVLEK